MIRVGENFFEIGKGNSIFGKKRKGETFIRNCKG